MRFKPYLDELAALLQERHGLRLQHVGRLSDDADEEFWITGPRMVAGYGDEIPMIAYQVPIKDIENITDREIRAVAVMTKRSRRKLQDFLDQRLALSV